MKHGWFEIPGVQTGERVLSERVGPLRYLLDHAKGATILDVGSAEGLISKWLIDEGGAKSAHLVEKFEPWLDEARRQLPVPPYDVKFSVSDIGNWGDPYTVRVLDLDPAGYDIVLALNVIQKIRTPRERLLQIANLARKFFVYSGPDSVLSDIRSGFDRIDVKQQLKDFTLVDFKKGRRSIRKGHLGVRMIFKRRGVKNK